MYIHVRMVISTFLLSIVAVNLASSSENIALNKPTMESNPAEYSSRANDGGYDPDFHQGSCSFALSNNEPYAWWIVDLGDVYRITHVVVAKRTGFDLSDVHFEMYMGVPLICKHQPAVCRYVPTDFSDPTHNVTCDDDTAVGRYLMIRHSPSSTKGLILCEVEVYGVLVPTAVQARGNCSGPVWLNRRADHGVVGDDVINVNETSPATCAEKCVSAGECSAFSFNTELSICEFSAGLMKALVKSSAGWITYDLC